MMAGTRSTVFLASMLLAFSVLSGCVQKPSVERCEKAATIVEKNQCWRALAKSLNDTSYCAMIDDDILKNYWCYREIAYDTHNNATCELIKTDARAKQSCYDIIAGRERFERGTYV